MLVSIASDRDPRFTAYFFEEFSASHGDIIDDEHYFSSTDGRLVKEDHPDFRGHAMSMHPRSQG